MTSLIVAIIEHFWYISVKTIRRIARTAAACYFVSSVVGSLWGMKARESCIDNLCVKSSTFMRAPTIISKRQTFLIGHAYPFSSCCRQISLKNKKQINWFSANIKYNCCGETLIIYPFSSSLSSTHKHKTSCIILQARKSYEYCALHYAQLSKCLFLVRMY